MVSTRRLTSSWHLFPTRNSTGWDGGGAMKHEVSTALYEYWLSRHRAEPVRASGIQPADLAPLLPSLFLIELESSDRPEFRFRFCGASVASRYGHDLTDESFLALWDSADKSMLQRDLRALAFRSTGMIAGVMAETLGGGVISYEMLLLPLAGESGAAGALGSMARIGGHDESNRIRARIVAQSLRSIRFLPFRGAPPSRLGMKKAGLSHCAPPEFPRRYGHLTVVNGGK